jgi:hypothetical protein
MEATDITEQSCWLIRMEDSLCFPLSFIKVNIIIIIIKGTEFFDGKLGRYVDSPVTDVLQMMGRAGRPQYDDTGVACIMVRRHLYYCYITSQF